jgi:hypothetical protein
MYPIEFYLKTLIWAMFKIKQNWQATLEEALGFCTKYLQDFIATNRRVWDEKIKP